MDWKPTDEEIKEAAKQGINSITEDNVDRWIISKTIIQAAQRKLVEWGDERCIEHHPNMNFLIRRTCRECWIQLRKELGLDAK